MKYSLLFFVVSLLACHHQENNIAANENQIFPLHKGNTWVYEATIKYHRRETDSVKEQKIEWKMEVIDTIQQGKYLLAIIKGFPTDLVWYEGNAVRGDFVLLQDSNKIYLNNYSSLDSLKASVKESKDSLIDLRNSQDLLFDFPLLKPKTWGADPEMPAREDSMYAWLVTQSSTDSSAGEIKYMTNPDHSIFQFQPKIGITGYYFEHHGTVMELKMKLINKILH